MKLNPKQIELFKALSRSEVGTELTEYLDQLSDYICDARNWGKDDTKESALQATKVVKEMIRNRIKVKQEDKKVATVYE